MFNTFVANRPAIDFCSDRFRYRLRRRCRHRRHRRRRIDGNEIRPIKEGRETGSYLLTLDLAITKRGNSLYNRKFLRRAPARKRIETVPRDYSDRRRFDRHPPIKRYLDIDVATTGSRKEREGYEFRAF